MSLVTIRPDAAADIEEAYLWYEHAQVGLGERFLSALVTTLKAITVYPDKQPEVYRGLRRVFLRRFPYSIFYKATDRGVLVVACFHASRDPRHWRKRT